MNLFIHCCIWFPFYKANFSHLLGIILFEKFGIAVQNRTFLDKLIVNFIVANIVLLAPTGILMIHRNLVGPFDNLRILKGDAQKRAQTRNFCVSKKSTILLQSL